MSDDNSPAVEEKRGRGRPAKGAAEAKVNLQNMPDFASISDQNFI